MGRAAAAAARSPSPRLVSQIEGRGNGIKTNVVNAVDIAKALERPPECEGEGEGRGRGDGGRAAAPRRRPTPPPPSPPSPDIVKYFGCELGAQTKFDKQVRDRGEGGRGRGRRGSTPHRARARARRPVPSSPPSPLRRGTRSSTARTTRPSSSNTWKAS
jgi:hypothetical protein